MSWQQQHHWDCGKYFCYNLQHLCLPSSLMVNDLKIAKGSLQNKLNQDLEMCFQGRICNKIPKRHICNHGTWRLYAIPHMELDNQYIQAHGQKAVMLCQLYILAIALLIYQH